MKLDEKKQLTMEMRDSLLESKALFIVDYRGLKVVELADFRNKLRAHQSFFRVVKNTLVNRALKEAKLEMPSGFFSGPTGIIFIQAKPLESARTVKEFISEHSNLKIKGGLLGNYLLDTDRVLYLADLPSEAALLSQLVAVLQVSLRRLIRVLNYPLINFILIAKAILEQKGGLSMPAKVKEVPNAGKKKEDQKMEKKDQIVKVIEQMNVLELSELVKELEDKFGVQAASPQVAIAAAPAQEKPKEEEKTEFDAILSEIGPKKIQVIKEVRKLTSLGLKEAKDLVEQAPKPVKEGVTKEEADKIKQTLEAVGAKVQLK